MRVLRSGASYLAQIRLVRQNAHGSSKVYVRPYVNPMNTQRGFTLIELLVVIAIIGVLSSVVLASLNTARLRARDASIKAEVAQFANLYELEYNDTGSYAALKPGWVYNTTNCNVSFSGTNAVTARQICSKIVTDVGGNGMYMSTSAGDDSNKWSIMVYLPGKNTTYCAGSSGAKTETPAWGNWTGAGCYTTP